MLMSFHIQFIFSPDSTKTFGPIPPGCRQTASGIIQIFKELTDYVLPRVNYFFTEAISSGDPNKRVCLPKNLVCPVLTRVTEECEESLDQLLQKKKNIRQVYPHGKLVLGLQRWLVITAFHRTPSLGRIFFVLASVLMSMGMQFQKDQESMP